MLLITILFVSAVFSAVMVQEWKSLTRTRQYTIKLQQAKPNVRIVEVK